jgi:hypothetical protein
VTLDERLAGAAETLRRSVRKPPPPFEQVRRRARRRRALGSGAGLVVAIALVAGAFALAPFGGTDDGSTVYGHPGPKGSAGAACLPVAAHDGHSQAGCALPGDLNGGAARIAELTTKFGGVPVYRGGSNSAQAGVLTPDLGFVPQAAVARLTDLRACWPAVQAMLADPAGAPLDPGCRVLMEAMGYPESFVEGRGYGR